MFDKGFTVKIYWLFLFCFFQILVNAQKNDTVYLQNGDRITGEVKKYENGLLSLKTDGMSTLSIEYYKIRTLYSAKFFEIETKSGFSYYGSLRKSSLPGNIDIAIANDTFPKPINEIVVITPIRHHFWKKFYGSADIGLSYYKSTNTLQYYLNSDINYRAKKDLVSFDMSLMFSNQKTSDSIFKTKKNDVGLDFSHFFQGRWWGGIGTKFQQNTELDLDYRIQLGLGAGYDIIHTNPIRFYAMAGLLVNREKPTDSVSYTSNFEGLMSVKFTWLQHRHPKINLSTNFDAFPSFTVSKRWRLEYNLSVKYEIVYDLYVSLNYYFNYDSKPSGGGPALNDWSVVFSIGYTF
jgi:hypothetical protein